MFKYQKTLDSLKPYVPGLNFEGAIKLSSNENPWGTSPLVQDAIRKNLDKLHIYPEGSALELRKQIGLTFGIDYNDIVVGNGSNELIDLVMRVFLSPDTEAISGEYSFAIYRIVAKAMGSTLHLVKTKNFVNDIEAIKSKVNDKTSIILLDNPNNPTGTYIDKDSLIDLIEFTNKRDIVLLIDEAYFEFVRAKDYISVIDLVPKYKNLILTRTFSKAYGLSALRVGYLYANRWIVNLLHKLRDPFNVGTLAQVSAIASLKDQDFVKQTVIKTHKAIDYITKNINLEYIPTQTNFITVKSETNLVEYLEQHNIIIRPLNAYNMPNYYRISVGTMEQNTKLVELLP